MNSILKKQIESDVYRHYENNGKPFLWKIRNIALLYTITYRKAHYYSYNNNRIRSIFYRYKLNKLTRKYTIQIPYTTTIGYGFNMVHFGRIVMAGGVRIGDNCNCFTGVTIGSTQRGKNKGVPTIGNDVWIGPNAVIVGNVNIGNNVMIAANSFVNFDVPDNSIVIGNPGQIISKENATEGYICQKYVIDLMEDI